jgi:hypothetical protein
VGEAGCDLPGQQKCERGDKPRRKFPVDTGC